MPDDAVREYLATVAQITAEAGLGAETSRFILFKTLLMSGHMTHRDPLQRPLTEVLASAPGRDDPDRLLVRQSLRQIEQTLARV
ncbi:hypothetical protein SAMN04488095_3105 [Jannaschia pohangensis]|uniref:Uncharacterized protein n=2 Tax=Jannaschia pohangensis TaxID=390807 RepID=A0A1I3SCS9_9RHOB|nr:hypothetical protein SAMN04488095_3105 [Jannaschia pohangensis]